MKKYMIIGAVLMSSMIFAQKETPKLEVVDNMVKATYYYDNGTIQQEGFFKDGKLEGKWIAYDAQGNKLSVGEYSNGQKTGKWFFYNEAKLRYDKEYKPQAFSLINPNNTDYSNGFSNNWNTQNRIAPINFSQNFSVGNRIRSWCSSNRRLIDFNYFIKVFEPFNLFIFQWNFNPVVNVFK